jgi:GAF domain-containing protein
LDDSDVLRSTIRALSQYFVGGVSLEDTLTVVAQLGTDTLPNADMAGITLLSNGKPTTAVFTDVESPEIDQAQYSSGEGPCLDAFRFGCSYRVDSMPSEDRWPAFVQSCLDHHVLSTLSMPLVIDGDSIGALNFYSRTEQGFPDRDERTAEVFADTAATVLANARAYWEAFNLSQNLSEAMKSRAVIEQAKGALMSQSGVSSDEAFQLLVRASQRENRKVRDIAEQIVDQTRHRR